MVELRRIKEPFVDYNSDNEEGGAKSSFQVSGNGRTAAVEVYYYLIQIAAAVSFFNGP